MSAHDSLLAIYADSVDDLEKARIAAFNRYRALTADAVNDHDSAKGMSSERPEAQRLLALAEALQALEHGAILELKRGVRQHPLWDAFGRQAVGVGEKQFARLLAAVGDPADRPNPAKLWQYCGHGDPERSRRVKGVQGLPYSPVAKMRTRLIAESCMKQRTSPYRPIYDAAREAWAERDTTDLHKHNHALRMVGKELLLDLWRAATELRGARSSTEPMSELPRDDHRRTTVRTTPRTRTSGDDLRRAIPEAKPTAVPLGDDLEEAA